MVIEKISKSLQLRDLEEITFQKYVDDFIRILGETAVIDSLYVLKDNHEQIKNRFEKCNDAFARREVHWITKLQDRIKSNMSILDLLNI